MSKPIHTIYRNFLWGYAHQISLGRAPKDIFADKSLKLQELPQAWEDARFVTKHATHQLSRWHKTKRKIDFMVTTWLRRI